MKTIKNYSFKIAVLLIALGSMAILYWYWYHKKFDVTCIPQNADGIMIVDMKNVRNYFIFSFLKSPSQWSSTAFDINKKFDFSDFDIETADYLALFHIETQPLTEWFAVAKIENGSDFEKAILKAHFIKGNLNNGMISYFSKSMGLLVIKHSNQILVSKIPKKRESIAVKIAEDLFLKKLFLDVRKIKKAIGTNNAITFWIKKNSFLKEDGILNLKLEDHEITVDGQLQFKSKYKKEWQFTQNPNALLSLGFDFEMIRNQDILKKHSIQINKIIGFDLDSILIQNPTKTELVLHEIIEKKDSAISYDYDDDFNPIQKVIVHTSREPSFYFSIETENSKKIFDYLKAQNAIDNHQLFVNFPLAPTKIFYNNTNLTLEANLSKKLHSKTSQPKIAYFQMHFNKLGSNDWNFLIKKNKKFQLLKSVDSMGLELTHEKSKTNLKGYLKIKEALNWITVQN